ncbi:MAG: glycoside hydrolase family 15 protein [Planctomycetota bacterium]|jgi:glucoamylase
MNRSFRSNDDTERIIDWAAERMLGNISPPGTRRGAVIASPSRSKPDYFYCWVRDAALVMDVVGLLLARTTVRRAQALYVKRLKEYVDFSRFTQTTPDRHSDLGEPKFHVDGTAFTEEWGRPQNDGPALRAITLKRFADYLLDRGRDRSVLKRLYTPVLPANSVIKADLEYVCHRWREKSFDYWEEVHADHFATRMVQRRALLDGAELADGLNEPGAAAAYRLQAASIGAELEQHWHPDAGYIKASLNDAGGHDYKTSGLDVAVILGVLHGEVPGQSFSVIDDYVLATALRIRDAFDGLYGVNAGTPDGSRGVAIGRYPEDRYNGYDSHSEGNPWFLAGNGFAEYYYRVATALRTRGEVRLTATNLAFYRSLLTPEQAATLSPGLKLNQKHERFDAILARLCREGDEFIRRTLHHADDGLSEQFHRTTGRMQGAAHLTWSYSSLVSALLHRPASAPYS